jgi:uncharacterized protein
LKTDISYLPKQKQEELKSIVKVLIMQYAEIEQIILFGSYARGTWVDDSYREDGITYQYTSDYDLLVILNNNNKATAETFIKSVNDKLKSIYIKTPVHAIFHGIEFVNKELEQGSYFFGDIKKEGICIFNTSRYELADKKELNPLEQQAKAQEYFDKWFESADEFFDYFTHGYSKAKYNSAAFLLHQATERYYNCIQLVFTGYKSKSHDLELLGGLAKSFNIEFGKVFPCSTVSEQERFTLLKKAYVDARYNINYHITKEDLEYLQERVKLLIVLTEKLCREKIASFVS